jgi:hypothetical protein
MPGRHDLAWANEDGGGVAYVMGEVQRDGSSMDWVASRRVATRGMHGTVDRKQE